MRYKCLNYMLVFWVCLMTHLDSEQQREKIQRAELRSLSHGCGFKPNWCCSSTMSRCYVCISGNNWPTNCEAGTFTPGYAGSNDCCCGYSTDCPKDPNFSSSGYNCQLTLKYGAKSQVSWKRSDGAALTIYSTYQDVFKADPACGYNDCEFLFKSGVDNSPHITQNTGGLVTLDATQALYGSGLYYMECGPKGTNLRKQSPDLLICGVDAAAGAVVTPKVNPVVIIPPVDQSRLSIAQVDTSSLEAMFDSSNSNYCFVDFTIGTIPYATGSGYQPYVSGSNLYVRTSLDNYIYEEFTFDITPDHGGAGSQPQQIVVKYGCVNEQSMTMLFNSTGVVYPPEWKNSDDSDPKDMVFIMSYNTTDLSVKPMSLGFNFVTDIKGSGDSTCRESKYELCEDQLCLTAMTGTDITISGVLQKTKTNWADPDLVFSRTSKTGYVKNFYVNVQAADPSIAVKLKGIAVLCGSEMKAVTDDSKKGQLVQQLTSVNATIEEIEIQSLYTVTLPTPESPYIKKHSCFVKYTLCTDSQCDQEDKFPQFVISNKTDFNATLKINKTQAIPPVSLFLGIVEPDQVTVTKIPITYEVCGYENLTILQSSYVNQTVEISPEPRTLNLSTVFNSSSEFCKIKEYTLKDKANSSTNLKESSYVNIKDNVLNFVGGNKENISFSVMAETIGGIQKWISFNNYYIQPAPKPVVVVPNLPPMFFDLPSAINITIELQLETNTFLWKSPNAIDANEDAISFKFSGNAMSEPYFSVKKNENAFDIVIKKNEVPKDTNDRLLVIELNDGKSSMNNNQYSIKIHFEYEKEPVVELPEVVSEEATVSEFNPTPVEEPSPPIEVEDVVLDQTGSLVITFSNDLSIPPEWQAKFEADKAKLSGLRRMQDASFDFLNVRIQSGTNDKEQRIGTENLLITELTPRGIKVKIVFPNRSELSLGDQSFPDKLAIDISGLKDANGNPISTEKVKSKQEASGGLTLPIKPMIDYEDKGIQFLEIAAMVIMIAGFVVIVCHFILMFWLGIPLMFLFNFIAALTNFAYLPLLSINQPGQVGLFIKKLVRVVSFDLISLEWLNKQVGLLSFNLVALPNDREWFSKIGLKDRNILTAMGTLFLVLVIYAFLQLIAQIAGIFKIHYYPRKIHEFLAGNQSYRGLFATFYVLFYLDLLMGSLLNTENDYFIDSIDNWGANGKLSKSDQFAFVFGKIFQGLSLFVPIWVVFILHTKNRNIRLDENKQLEYDQKFGTLYEGIKTQGHYWWGYFYGVFVFRKMLFGLMVYEFWQPHFTFAQVQITLLMSILFLVFLYFERPFKEPTYQKLQLFNEFCFYFMACALLGFTDNQTTPAIKLKVAWFFVIINILVFIANLLFYLILVWPEIKQKRNEKRARHWTQLGQNRMNFIRSYNEKLKDNLKKDKEEDHLKWAIESSEGSMSNISRVHPGMPQQASGYQHRGLLENIYDLREGKRRIAARRNRQQITGTESSENVKSSSAAQSSQQMAWRPTYNTFDIHGNESSSPSEQPKMMSVIDEKDVLEEQEQYADVEVESEGEQADKTKKIQTTTSPYILQPSYHKENALKPG